MLNLNNWEFQKNANILAFLTAPEYEERKQILENICQNASKISWALSCSSNLFFRGIVDDFNDYDILVKLDDVESLKNVLRKIGAEINENTVQKNCFTSPYYQQAKIGKFDFDLVGDITINTFNGSYCYQVKDEEINFVTIDGNINIPLIPVEACFVLYGMMEGWQSRRRLKRDLCFNFLRQQGVSYPGVLQDALNQDIPSWLQEIIKQFL